MSNMTMTQKIIAAHAGRDSVAAGEIVLADVDLVLGNDVTAPVAVLAFDELINPRVFDNGKIALVRNHELKIDHDAGGARQPRVHWSGDSDIYYDIRPGPLCAGERSGLNEVN